MPILKTRARQKAERGEAQSTFFSVVQPNMHDFQLAATPLKPL